MWKSTVRIFPKCCGQESRPPLLPLRRSRGPGPPPGRRVTLQLCRRFQGREAPRGAEEDAARGPAPEGVREAGRPRERAGADARRRQRAGSLGGRRGRKVVGRVGRVGAGGRGPRAPGAELPRRSRDGPGGGGSGGSGSGGGGRGVFSGAQCRMVLEAAAAAVVAAASLAAAGGGAVAAAAAAPAGGVKWRISRS